MIRRVRWTAGILTAALWVSGNGLQTPVFRSRVDVVTVDVAVIDGNGRPVTGLTAQDFSIVADRRTRRVVSADYISVGTSRTVVTAPGAIAAPAASSSNSQPTSGRTFLFVVDTDQLYEGAAKGLMTSLSDAVARLRPDDRVGLIAAPYNTPNVDITTNRALVQDALKRITGGAIQNQGYMMTVGEAASVEALDDDVLKQYLDRINAHCADALPGLPGLESDVTLSCMQRFHPVATKVMQAERRRTQYLFATLRQLADAMGSIDGPKAIVLISQGTVNDRETIDAQRQFAQAAERALVTLFAINTDSPMNPVSSLYNLTSAHARDHQVLLDGMSRLATAGRGDVFMASGTIDKALERIDAELSGYYLLSFERDRDDRTGERETIQIHANWPNATVRARTEFTLDMPKLTVKPLAPADPRAAIGEMLRWPLPVTDMGMDLVTYSSPVAGSANEQRTIIAADVASGGHRLIAAGYEVADGTGKVVAGHIDPESTSNKSRTNPTPIETPSIAGDRKLFTVAAAVPPGHYKLKLALIDDTGRRGSLTHDFDVRVSRLGALRLGDLMIGEVGSSGFMPTAGVPPGAATLPVRVELCADNSEAFNGVTVALELGRPGAAPFAHTPISVVPTNDTRRRLASATLTISSLPPGTYQVTAILSTADGSSVKSSRVFTKR